jgi:hypothetical protein
MSDEPRKQGKDSETPTRGITGKSVTDVMTAQAGDEQTDTESIDQDCQS